LEPLGKTGAIVFLRVAMSADVNSVSA